MNVSMFAFELPDYVKEAHQKERSAGNDRKCSAPFGVQRDTAPRNQNPQSRREQDMTAARVACHYECLGAIPTLRPRRYNKRQPVCRNCGMDRKSTRLNSSH